MRTVALVVLCVTLAASRAATQDTKPTFEVVSVKRHAGPGTSMSMMQRPDGGFTMINMPIRTLITQAYGPVVDVIGLPGWATNNSYDVNTTASLPRPPTQEDRRAMMQAMLENRFKLLVHMETREQPAYDLVFARSDRRLGRNATASDVDCEAKAAAERAAAEAARAAGAPPVLPTLPPRPDLNAPPGECSVRTGGGRMLGEASPAGIARILRMAVGQPVFDKTGYSGTLKFTLDFDVATSLRPDATPTSDAPSIFSALPDQLGFKLEPSRTTANVVVIERIEQPTEN
jgi:uncharacterized protein (TIGR03435 family)